MFLEARTSWVSLRIDTRLCTTEMNHSQKDCARWAIEVGAEEGALDGDAVGDSVGGVTGGFTGGGGVTGGGVGGIGGRVSATRAPKSVDPVGSTLSMVQVKISC